MRADRAAPALRLDLTHRPRPQTPPTGPAHRAPGGGLLRVVSGSHVSGCRGSANLQRRDLVWSLCKRAWCGVARSKRHRGRSGRSSARERGQGRTLDGGPRAVQPVRPRCRVARLRLIALWAHRYQHLQQRDPVRVWLPLHVLPDEPVSSLVCLRRRERRLGLVHGFTVRRPLIDTTAPRCGRRARADGAGVDARLTSWLPNRALASC